MAEGQEKPTIMIPFSTICHVINTHKKQHSYLDISYDIKKCPYEEGDLYDKNKEDITEEIEHLKKHCVREFWHGPQL